MPSTATDAITTLKTLWGQISDLSSATSLLHWDMEIMMPVKGANARASQLSTLSELIHQKMTHPDLQAALSDAQNQLDSLSREDKALVRELTRSVEQATKLPSKLVAKEAELTTKAHHIWVDARKNKDFKAFAPILSEIVALNKEKAECFGYSGTPYNALLDLFEPGLTVTELDGLFGQLKPALIELVSAIENSTADTSFPFLNNTFDADKQWAFSERVLRDMGYDFEAGRLDKAPHPFCTNFGIHDVRLTTRVYENDVFSALFSSMHEGGHGLVEQGANPAFERTPLTGASMGIHESQSRMWENLVGRSKAFWTFYHPHLQAMFPEQLKHVSLDQLYAAVNRSQPSYIRVESDEVTYNLHIILRYELEKALMTGELAVADLPDAWNRKMHDFLGITPHDDAQGVLQDVHWSGGMIGYFPTYTLGNLYSAQFFNTAKKELGNLDEQISQGKLTGLKQWLNKAIHLDGQVDLPRDIVKRVTGEAPNSAYFLDYLWDKYSPIYGLTRP